MRKLAFFKLLLLVLAISVSSSVTAQKPTATEGKVFKRLEYMVPMRDGVRLQTVLFVPNTQNGPLPILFSRTPYGVPDDESKIATENNASLIRDGYIFAMQNIRGRFKSEGTFVMQRPPRDRSNPKSIDEGTDAFDTIEWLLENVPNNNGRVGMTGGSYSAWLIMMALTEAHPALKAAIEAATPADMFLGDDFHHYGAFRLAYGFEYSAYLEAEKNANYHFDFGKYDTYDFYLHDLGALSNANPKFFHGKLPTWNNFVAHPNRDAFWKAQAMENVVRRTTIPIIHVAGWWDQEDFYGPQKSYELLEPNDPNRLNYFVAGPWNHGGWGTTGDSLGPIAFDSETGKHYRENISVPWFRHWLHGSGTASFPEAQVFETGTNRWKIYNAWPPQQGLTERKLYFHANRKLSFDSPQETENAFDSFVSDPVNPVPYRPRPIPRVYPSPEWKVWLVEDQRFADHRPDVLTWQTEPLTEDLTIAGNIVADIFASTSGTDSDWVVKLIDVYPEKYQPSEAQKKLTGDRDLSGYQLMIANEVFRGRFRNSFDAPGPIPSGKVEEYKIDLHTNAHVFLKGHRIMVQVQSTWFPLIDRNPQKYVPNIFEAKDTDFMAATQKVYRANTQASSVVLPVMTTK